MLKTWDNYSSFAIARGELVLHIIQGIKNVKNLNVLDLGCGEGATAYIFAKNGAYVTAIDRINKIRFTDPKIFFKKTLACKQAILPKMFDVILLQDVIEHLPNDLNVLELIDFGLKDDGIFYISTPNRLSPLNIIGDPHWGIPFISLCSRKYTKWIIKDVLKIDKRNRDDWAALFSLYQLKKHIHKNYLNFIFRNKTVAHYLLKKPIAVLCSSFHLRFIDFLKHIRLFRWIPFLVNDKFGFFNYFINPTWYIVGWKNNCSHVPFRKVQNVQNKYAL